MGILISKIFKNLFKSKNEFKILILGLANAGKTTLLYQLNLGECISTQPTIGCNIEEIRTKNVKIQAWDIGGQESLRSVWPSYFQNTAGIIYMIDSSEKRQAYLEQSREELFRLLGHDELAKACFLILANKSDLQESQSIDAIAAIFGFTQIKTHSYHIQQCSAKNNQGVQSGLDWLVQNMLQIKGQ